MDLNEQINDRIKRKMATCMRRKWLAVHHDHAYDKSSSPSAALQDHNYSHCDAASCIQTRIKYDAGPLPLLFDCSAPLAMYLCPWCPYTSNFITSLRLHTMEFHSKVERVRHFDHVKKCYVCNLCTFQTHSSLFFLRHPCSKSYGFSLWYCCGRCDFKSWMYDALENHQTSQHFNFFNPRSFQCGECHYTCNSETWLKRHLEAEHFEKKRKVKRAGAAAAEEGAGGLWRCSLCAFKTADPKLLERHVREHAELKIHWYQCGQCTLKTSDAGCIESHQCNKEKEFRL